MTDKIHLDGDEITQALEDVRSQYIEPGESQTEKSRRAVLEEIRALLRAHPEMSNKEIALEVGSTPKQVSAQRYLMSDKGKAQSARYCAWKKNKKAAQAAEKGKESEKKVENMEEKGNLPELQAVVRRMSFIGNVAEYVVEDGDVEIEIINDGLDSTFPVEKLGEIIAELTALKLMLEKGTFAELQG